MKLDKYYNQNQSEDGAEQTVKEPQAPEVEKPSKYKVAEKLEVLSKNKFLIIGLIILIIVVNVVLRAGLLQFQGLFEPDGFFYYSIIRATVLSHGREPQFLGISGFPSHNFIGEAPGLPYLTYIFYIILHPITGLSALVIMRWLPILFGVIYALLAFLLAKYISKSNILGLLAMLFVSISSGNIARTAGLVYRGDTFITFFIMLALLFMLKCFDDKKRPWKILWGVLASFTLSLGILIWNGSPFIIVVYMFALLFTILYGFIFSDDNVMFSALVLSGALILTNIFQRVFVALGGARSGLELAGNSFFILYVPIVLGSIFTYLLMKNKHRLSLANTTRGRAIILGVAALVAIAVMVAAFGGSLSAIASPLAPVNSTGAVVTNATKAAIVSTTQELQPPTWSFIWSSFSLQLYLAPLGVILFVVLAYLASKGDKFIKKDHFNLNNVGFLAMFAYFIVTAYLQLSAIRFNAIISIPLAIFAAFGLYAIAKLVYNMNIRRGVLSIVIVAMIIILAAALVYNFIPILTSRFLIVVISVAIILVVCAALVIYGIYALVKGHLKLKYIVLGIVLFVLLYNFYNTYFESYTAAQADGINPQFLTAMTWLKNNTQTNATVLALWPDGSVVEGWGNRTSYMDSVGGENGTRIFAFANFLFNTTRDSNYLYNIHRPQYLVVRNFWYEELGGIAQEGLVANASAYGYVILTSLNSSSNGTAQFFTFSTNQAPYYKAELIIVPGAVNVTSNTITPSRYYSYLGVQNSTRLTLMRSVLFLNSTDSTYSIINNTGASANNSINYTLLVSFSGRVVNGAYILGPKLVDSNLFQFTFLCNANECPYDNNNVTANAVYINSDTRIFKLNYLH